jgi:hypothetical protein
MHSLVLSSYSQGYANVFVLCFSHQDILVLGLTSSCFGMVAIVPCCFKDLPRFLSEQCGDWLKYFHSISVHGYQSSWDGFV